MFTAIDAIILYALFNPLANEDVARVKEMISFFDYINHAMLTHEELSACLGRLRASGLIVVTQHSIHITPLCSKWRSTMLKRKKVSIYKELKEIEMDLNASFTNSQVEDDECLDKAVYEIAIKDYLKNGDN